MTITGTTTGSWIGASFELGKKSWGWKYGSAVKKKFGCFRGPDFNFQHPLWDAHDIL